jgi:large subunit ribosomal protein L33
MPEKMTDTSSGMRKMTMQMKTLEVEVVRVKITLACNYNMTKEKKNHPERMETQKYCKFCRKHTLHKETK